MLEFLELILPGVTFTFLFCVFCTIVWAVFGLLYELVCDAVEKEILRRLGSKKIK